MALGVVQQSKTVPGSSYEWQFFFTGDASYPNGGYIITAQTLGVGGLSRIGKIFSPDVVVLANGINSAMAIPTYASGPAPNVIQSIALHLFAAGVEVATGATAAGSTVALMVHGT